MSWGPVMRDKLDVENQWEQLAAHRSSLAILLTQQAKTGIADSPLSLLQNIQHAREGIRGCKAALRSWGEDVIDLPNDEPPPANVSQSRAVLAPTPYNQAATTSQVDHSAVPLPNQRQKLIAWLLIGAILGGLLGYFV